ncbi:MAG: hypothetical protein D5S03_01415 [Desulfonatronospira sp. MSAO_Bac3]|nr:MAG: hypothetical protein D5S03_01415 [Desulfonatronospira sp. MSAO_Bac3]
MAWIYLGGGSLITIQMECLTEACDRVLPCLDLLPSLAKEGSYTVAWIYFGGGSLITIQMECLTEACDRVLPCLNLLPSLVKEGLGVVR